VGAFEWATRVTEPSLHADLRQAESARFSGRMLAFVGADQIGGAVFSEGRVGWAIHRAQAENLGTFLERLGRVGRAQLGEIRRTYEASDKRQSFATVLEQAQLVPQPIFRRCLLLHNRCALAELSRAPELRLERRPGAGAGEKAMLFALGELMTELAPEPSTADRVERWRTLHDENRPLAPLAEVPGFRAAAALNAEGQVLAGFAGATADAFQLFELFEKKLKEHARSLPRAAVELAKQWRTDRLLRRLEALLVVADREHLLVLSGAGDVIEPDVVAGGEAAAIGSGGPYALVAARALLAHSPLDARAIAQEAMKLAAEICIYTNANLSFEELP